MSELRTRRRDRGRSRVRSVQGRLSMLYEDEDASGQTPAEPPLASSSENSASVEQSSRPAACHLLRSFTRWLIVASWRTGRSNGASNGVGVPTRWKKVGSPGEMRKRRPLSKSGTSSATMLPNNQAESLARIERRAKLIRRVGASAAFAFRELAILATADCRLRAGRLPQRARARVRDSRAIAGSELSRTTRRSSP